MSDRKYENIHLVDEEKRNTSDHKGQQLGFICHLAVFVGTRKHFKLEMEHFSPLNDWQ